MKTKRQEYRKMLFLLAIMSHKLTKYENPLRRSPCSRTVQTSGSFGSLRRALIDNHPATINTWYSVIG